MHLCILFFFDPAPFFRILRFFLFFRLPEVHPFYDCLVNPRMEEKDIHRPLSFFDKVYPDALENN